MEIVLNTYGTSISRDNEAFIISTHEGKRRISIDGVSSIRIGRSAQITSDAILLAIENEVDVVFSDRSGNTVGRVWSPRYGSISAIRKGQLCFSQSRDAVEWIKKIIEKKLDNQQAMLLLMKVDNTPYIAEIDKAINKIEYFSGKVKKLEGDYVNDIASAIRGVEGYAAKVYFDAMNLYLPEEYRFDNRTQHPALDVTNALLNYGYGMLYGKIESSLIRSGIDPYIGILHRDEYNRPVLVYDIIELYRIWVDYVVWSLLIHKSITDEFYSINEDGSCWLEALGRRVIIQSMNDYMEDVVTYKGIARSRRVQIDLYTQELAQIFRKYQQSCFHTLKV